MLVFSVNGTDGDGTLTLTVGVGMIAVGGIALITKPGSDWWWLAIWVAGLLMSAAVLVIAAYDIHNVRQVAGDQSALGTVRVGGGLYVTAVAGVCGLLASVPGFFAGHR